MKRRIRLRGRIVSDRTTPPLDFDHPTAEEQARAAVLLARFLKEFDAFCGRTWSLRHHWHGVPKVPLERKRFLKQERQTRREYHRFRQQIAVCRAYLRLALPPAPESP